MTGTATVLIFHQSEAPRAGPLTSLLARARLAIAERRAGQFRALGVEDVRIVEEPWVEPYGLRLARLASGLRGGLVTLGSGAAPLARDSDLVPFVEAAHGARQPVSNNPYSSDIVAVPDASVFTRLPPLASDNAVPRWLAEHAGIGVTDLRGRWRLQVDLDSPADLALLPLDVPGDAEADLLGPLSGRLAEVRGVLADPQAEILVAGRSSAATLRLLEARAACRTRFLSEERGLRAADWDATRGRRVRRDRPPVSILGTQLDRDGPSSIGDLAAQLADAAVIDSRVLLAHRLGRDERAWPMPEDRYASDLLLAARIEDPWLAALTTAAARAPVPVVLGAHTLVGPGLRVLLPRGTRRSSAR